MMSERARQDFEHYEYAYCVPGFAGRDHQKGQSFIELTFIERASNSYRECNMCAFPLPASLRTQTVDELQMMNMCCIFLRFLSFRPIPFLREIISITKLCTTSCLGTSMFSCLMQCSTCCCCLSSTRWGNTPCRNTPWGNSRCANTR